MAISVLGPLEAEGLRPRDRLVLAALAARRGAVVTADEFADACWGPTPPGTWWQQIKSSVASIRAELGSDVIRTDVRGYGLGVDPGTLDSVRFESLIEEGRRWLVLGEPARAVTTLRSALALWRGNPFDEVSEWPPARAEAARLEGLRSSADEELLEARLATGETAGVVPDAERSVQQQPLREARWAVLALAQYRASRQGEALATLRAARARLAEELGIEPSTRLSALEVGILRQDPALDGPAEAAEPWVDCPYLGLHPFSSDVADRFFGRAAEVETLLDRLQPGAVVAIVGPSGSGKSSLLLAGVLPAVRAGARTHERVTLDGTAADAVEALVRRPRRPDVVAIDQFEEAFLLDAALVERLGSGLGRLLDDGATLVLTLRSDHLDRATALPSVGSRIGGGVFALGPIGEDGIRQIVERPARAAGLRVEPGLVELIVRDAGGRPTALPHLSHALVETWRRREGGTLTVDGYETSGGIAGAIANSAEDRFQQLSPGEQQACRSLLMRLLDRDDEGGVIRRRISLGALLGDVDRGRAIERLVSSRLLAVDGDTLLVTHEAVARAWPRLAGWLSADADSALLLRRVEEGAATWVDGGGVDADLPRGPRLAALLEWQAQSGPDLTTSESAFLSAAADLQRSEVDELASRAAAGRRQNRRLRLALVATGVLVVVALVAGSFAAIRERDATAAEATARTEAIAAVATSLVGTDRDAGALLAAELYRRDPSDVRARSALMALLTAPGSPDSKIVFPEDERIFAGPIPGTDHVLVAEDAVARSADGRGLRLSIWNLRTGHLVERLPIRLPDAVTYYEGSIHIRGDGVALVAYSTWDPSDHTDVGTVLASVDTRSGRLLAGPVTIPIQVAFRGAFLPGGRTFVTRSPTMPTPVWIDVAKLTAHEGKLVEDSDADAVTLLDDGQIAVSASDRINRFDPVTGALRGSTELPADLASYDIATVGDGTILLAGPAGTARMDERTGRLLWRAAPVGKGCDQLHVLADLGTFICSESQAWEASISDGLQTGRTFNAQAEWVFDAALVGGALMLVNQRTRPFVLRFPVDGSGPISTVVAPRRATVAGFADDRTIVVGAQDSTPEGTSGQYLWDLRTQRSVGGRSGFIQPLGGGVVSRDAADGSTQVLARVGRMSEWPLHGGALGGPALLLMRGSTPKRAFAVAEDWIQPFDPRTGAAIGPVLDFTGKGLGQYWVMVHDAPRSTTALVSWWDEGQSTVLTAVFDLRTGKKVARGLTGDVASVMLNDGGVISTTSSELRRSSPDLHPVDSLPKPVAGANRFELSADGRTLLLQGEGQPAALYDVPSGTKLGNEIATQSPHWPSAHLSPDGRTLVTNESAGVVAWDLDARAMAVAACKMAGRALTATEWRGYFGDEQQVDTCRTLRI